MANLNPLTATGKIKDEWQRINENDQAINNQLEAHVAGTADKHNSQAIEDTSRAAGDNQQQVNNNFKDQIDSISSGSPGALVSVFKATDATNTDAYVATISGLTLADTMRINLRVHNGNTGAATLNLNGTGAKAIVWEFNNERQPVTAGMVNGVSELQYDGTNDVYLLLTRDGIKPSLDITQNSPIDQVGGDTYKNTLQDGSQFVKMEVPGDFFVNNPQNPDFSNTANWNSVGGNLTASNNIGSFTGDGTDDNPRIETEVESRTVNGTNEFSAIRARVTNADCLELILQLRLGNGSVLSQSVSNPVQNQWYSIFDKFVINVDNANAVNLVIRHRYADAATANGKTLEVDGEAGVTSGNLTAMDKASLTAQQAFDKYASNGALANGLNFVQGELKVVGKNHVSGIEQGGISSAGLDIFENSSIRSENIDKILANTQVTFKISGIPNINVSSFLVAYYDSNNNFVSRIVEDFSLVDESTFTTSENISGFRLYAFQVKSDNSDLTAQEISDLRVQVEIGTTATAHADYDDSSAHSPVLRGVITAQDGWNPETGETPRRVAPRTLADADIPSIFTGYTNVDAVRLAYTNLTGVIIPSGSDIVNTDMTIEGFSPLNGGTVDSAESEYKHFKDNANIFLIVPKGTYANVAAARTDLVTTKETKMVYQLAQPFTEQNESMQATAERGGTMQFGSPVINSIVTQVALNGESRNNETAEAVVQLDKKIDRVADNLGLVKQASGLVNELAITTQLEPVLQSVLYVYPNITNTGAVTLKVNNNDAIPLEKIDASGADTALVAGDIVANRPFAVMFRSNKYILIN